MSEEKVWVEKMPKSCDECPCHSIMEDRCVLLRKQAIRPFLQSCPLKSLKTHDRELVKKVCEKIKNLANERTSIDTGMLDMVYFDNVIDKIEKEFEDENNED